MLTQLVTRHEKSHSGQFMISSLDDDAEDNFESIPGVVLQYKIKPNNNKNCSICVPFQDLSSLMHNLNIAYTGKITSPKWNQFKGVSFSLRDKIRLNNIIWREYHRQYIYQLDPVVVQFQTPLSESHAKPEAIILEGKYWKRNGCTISNEYQKWRNFFRNQPHQPASATIEELLEAVKKITAPHKRFVLKSDAPEVNDLGGIKMSSHPLQNYTYHQYEFENNLDSLMNRNLSIPIQRDIGMLGNSDVMQPGLTQLQPILDDIRLFRDPNNYFQTAPPQQQQQQPFYAKPQSTLIDTYGQKQLQQQDYNSINIGQQLPRAYLMPTKRSHDPSSITTGHGNFSTAKFTRIASAERRTTLSRRSGFTSKHQHNHKRSFVTPMMDNCEIIFDQPINSAPYHQIHSLPSSEESCCSSHPSSMDYASVAAAAAAAAATNTAANGGRIFSSCEFGQNFIDESSFNFQRVQPRETTTFLDPTFLPLPRKTPNDWDFNANKMETNGNNSFSTRSLPKNGFNNISSSNQNSPGQVANYASSNGSEERRRVSQQASLQKLHQLVAQHSGGSGRFADDCYSLSGKESLADSNNAGHGRISKANILQQAAKLIRSQRDRKLALQKEHEQLRSIIANHRAAINACCDKFPQASLSKPPERRGSASADSPHRDWLHRVTLSRTQQDWRWFVYSLLMGQLFDSYATCVDSVTSQETYQQAILGWLNYSCSLANVRPIVAPALCELNSVTDVLMQPKKLSAQCLQAAKRQSSHSSAVNVTSNESSDSLGGIAEDSYAYLNESSSTIID